MSQVLVESGKAGKLLVIDADPAMGLLTALGTRVNPTMGQVREDIVRTARGGKQKHKDQIIDSLDYMAFEINEVWHNGDTGTSKTYQQFMEAVQAEGAEVRSASFTDDACRRRVT